MGFCLNHAWLSQKVSYCFIWVNRFNRTRQCPAAFNSAGLHAYGLDVVKYSEAQAPMLVDLEDYAGSPMEWLSLLNQSGCAVDQLPS